jgi:anthranilate phosphoribosyltransferase
MLDQLTAQLIAGNDLTRDEMTAAVDQMMRGATPPNEIAAFLLALQAKGETVDEITGAALAMRQHMTPIRTTRSGVVDTCGTGGVGSALFNVSTSAAIVAAACGVPVAKHGNRSVTSKSGSADVLAALGVKIDCAPEVVERCLEELGLCFCFAQSMHPAMKHVGPVRKQLGVQTIFNLLGPLCNPASAPFQVMGVGRPELRSKLAAVLQALGCEHAVAVTGADGLGELTLTGETFVSEVTPRGVREFVWTPEDFGLVRASTASMLVEGPEASAAMIRDVLAGTPGPARDIVILNAAAALWTAGYAVTPPVCAARAAEAIDSGAARRLLSQLVALTQS